MPDPDRQPTPPASRGWVARALDALGAAVAAVWRVIHAALLVIKPARMSLIMVAGALAFLFVADQGLDTLRHFAEHKTGSLNDLSQHLAFWLGGFLWTYGSWYWPRVMYRIRLHEAPPARRAVRWMQLWIPRLIGALAIFGLALAFHRAAAPYPAGETNAGSILERYALYSLAGGIVFVVFVIKRRDWAPRLARWIERSPGAGALRRSLREVKPVDAELAEMGTRDAFDALREARFLLGLTLLVAAMLWVSFSISPERMAPRFGSTPILLLAAAGWIAVGSAGDLFAMVKRFPLWITALVVVVAFSFFNDNHAVRTLASESPPPWTSRPTVERALMQWQQRQAASPRTSADGTIALFVVAVEGGGIRAAYWTASVLGEIQDRHPCFADQLFALSGVSGGSLGAAVFTALLAEPSRRAAASDCTGNSAAGVRSAAQYILGEDFLSPVIAAMLYPDLFQRVWPRPVAHWDRARALEVAWEQAWQLHAAERGLSSPDRLGAAFDQLWRNQGTAWLPALLLNSTWVETGQRLIVSNLQLTSQEFADVEDANRFFGDRALRMSTAIHLSARFTFVSPPGTLVRDGKVHGRAVDGGYFENSGATTALEILKAVDQMQSRCGAVPDCFWNKVKPVLIVISNEPADLDHGDTSLETDPARRSAATQPAPCCNETWSPLRALLATRGARGDYAVATARWHVGPKNFLHFGLCKDTGATFPLGWSLSAVVRQTMDAQLRNNTSQSCPPHDNRAHFDALTLLLAPAAASPSGAPAPPPAVTSDAAVQMREKR